jgi:hyperosmotically inducible periplasmic protein
MRILTQATLAALVCAASMTACNDSGAHAKDNTGINERDSEGSLPTPMDQGGSEAELEITQEIRKAVVADDELSVSAENIKIITVGSVVTLRGPVKSSAEKSRIESIARSVHGVTRIENLLEVAPD